MVVADWPVLAVLRLYPLNLHDRLESNAYTDDLSDHQRGKWLMHVAQGGLL